MTVVTSGRAAFCRRVAISAIVAAWTGAALAAGVSVGVGGTGVSASVGTGATGATAGVGVGTGGEAGVGASANVGATGAANATVDANANLATSDANADLAVDGVSIGATVGLGATGSTTGAPPSGATSVSASTANGLSPSAVRLAAKRLRPQILSAPALYDDDLIVLCLSSRRL